jgi:hypothetical protein
VGSKDDCRRLPSAKIFARFYKSGGSENFGPSNKNWKNNKFTEQNKYWKAAFAYNVAGTPSLGGVQGMVDSV